MILVKVPDLLRDIEQYNTVKEHNMLFHFPYCPMRTRALQYCFGWHQRHTCWDFYYRDIHAICLQNGTQENLKFVQYNFHLTKQNFCLTNVKRAQGRGGVTHLMKYQCRTVYSPTSSPGKELFFSRIWKDVGRNSVHYVSKPCCSNCILREWKWIGPASWCCCTMLVAPSRPNGSSYVCIKVGLPLIKCNISMDPTCTRTSRAQSNGKACRAAAFSIPMSDRDRGRSLLGHLFHENHSEITMRTNTEQTR